MVPEAASSPREPGCAVQGHTRVTGRWRVGLRYSPADKSFRQVGGSNLNMQVSSQPDPQSRDHLTSPRSALPEGDGPVQTDPQRHRFEHIQDAVPPDREHRGLALRGMMSTTQLPLANKQNPSPRCPPDGIRVSLPNQAPCPTAVSVPQGSPMTGAQLR